MGSVGGGIGDPCDGQPCEFSPGGVKVSCAAASGPSSLTVNESGIMVGTCNDGKDNDCDGDVDEDDSQCPGLVDNCNKSGDVGKECTGAPDDVGGINITDGYYCDTNTSTSKNRCCPTGSEWNNATGSCETQSQGCYLVTCSYKPFVGNETNIPEQKWWNYSSNPCIRISQSEACVRDGFKFGKKYYSYKSVSSY